LKVTNSSNICVTLKDTMETFQDSKVSLKHRLADDVMNRLLGAERRNSMLLSLSVLEDANK